MDFPVPGNNFPVFSSKILFDSVGKLHEGGSGIEIRANRIEPKKFAA
jgi:hypothetical protein